MEATPLASVERRWKYALQATGARGCLEASVLVDVAAKGRRSAHFAQAMDHVALCACCTDTLRSLRELDKERKYRPLTLVLSGTAIAAACGLVLYFGNHSAKPLSAAMPSKKAHGTVSHTTTAPSISSVKKDSPSIPSANRVVTPKVRRRLAGLLAMSDGKWLEGGEELPHWAIAEVRTYWRTPASSRGLVGVASVALTSPLAGNSGLATLPRIIRWKAVENAVGYDAVVEADGKPVLAHVSAHQAQLSLLSADVHQIKVTITPVLDPMKAPPSQVARASTFGFHILSRSERKRLRWADSHRKRAPLAAAMTYYKLGFNLEAAQCLSKISNRRLEPWKQEFEMAAGRLSAGGNE